MSEQLRKKILFIMIFGLLGFGAMQVPFSQLVGAPSNIKFSLFDFFGPIAGGFIGSVGGVVAVLVMQLVNWAVKGFPADVGTIIRLFPMLFAVWYFSKKSRLVLFVPIIAMIAFWAHPEGRQAWYYALYWTIPLCMHVIREKFLFARALGATFTAHSVGGALWIWFFHMKAALWIGLIPIVWKERLLMAVGITLMYIVCNAILHLAKTKFQISLASVATDPTYFWQRK